MPGRQATYLGRPRVPTRNSLWQRNQSQTGRIHQVKLAVQIASKTTRSSLTSDEFPWFRGAGKQQRHSRPSTPLRTPTIAQTAIPTAIHHSTPISQWTNGARFKRPHCLCAPH